MGFFITHIILQILCSTYFCTTTILHPAQVWGALHSDRLSAASLPRWEWAVFLLHTCVNLSLSLVFLIDRPGFPSEATSDMEIVSEGALLSEQVAVGANFVLILGRFFVFVYRARKNLNKPAQVFGVAKYASKVGPPGGRERDGSPKALEDMASAAQQEGAAEEAFYTVGGLARGSSGGAPVSPGAGREEERTMRRTSADGSIGRMSAQSRLSQRSLLSQTSVAEAVPADESWSRKKMLGHSAIGETRIRAEKRLPPGLLQPGQPVAAQGASAHLGGGRSPVRGSPVRSPNPSGARGGLSPSRRSSDFSMTRGSQRSSLGSQG